MPAKLALRCIFVCPASHFFELLYVPVSTAAEPELSLLL